MNHPGYSRGLDYTSPEEPGQKKPGEGNVLPLAGRMEWSPAVFYHTGQDNYGWQTHVVE